ncbi:BgTH12-00073 [Blumeria graminis f. sp. triticale]|uniref:BgTH12-00073 n=1 Tax=Blumeria graminis f. sp. triticale TaxID=1689686 RepID=A0A9W4GGF3_BLUGR|nr:BgTH12-00073 [Blumeria graminis f. sp. triticale]
MTIYKPRILKVYNYMANIDVEIIAKQMLQRK